MPYIGIAIFYDDGINRYFSVSFVMVSFFKDFVLFGLGPSLPQDGEDTKRS